MRKERDSLGVVEVPDEAYYGAQTRRALVNFPISGLRSHPELVRAAVVIKKAAALANAGSGRLAGAKAEAIVKACDEVLAGKLADEFVVDVFQMGAGTSFHMNVNEVLANRAEEILGGKRGEYRIVHPNDDVNAGQSTNDVYPTAMRLAALRLLREKLRPALLGFEDALFRKAEAFDPVLKSGRTHLQDATPIRLGQEFRAYGSAVRGGRESIERASGSLLMLGIGGSAVGTGINTRPGFGDEMTSRLAAMTGFDLKPALDLREAMQSLRPMAEVSSALRNLALELIRIANDLRLLASGPATGLAEIRLPAAAPGSSIMPGKVNPSLLEMLNMVCFQIIGGDAAIGAAVQAGQLELNVMMPVVAFNLDFMIEILSSALTQTTVLCIEGLEADAERCRKYAEASPGIATALSPTIGYEEAARVAKKAVESGRSVIEIVAEEKLIDPERLADLLDPWNLTGPNIRGR
jgi:aspartate ammonia-lyase